MMDTDLTDNQPGEGVAARPGGTVVSGDKERQMGAEVDIGVEVRPEKPELTPELKEIGVEAKAEPKPKLDKRLEKIGVRPTGTAAPFAPVPAKALPLSDDQILAGQKQSVMNSLRWLAAWCLRQLKKAHISLKKFHGQVIRIRRKRKT